MQQVKLTQILYFFSPYIQGTIRTNLLYFILQKSIKDLPNIMTAQHLYTSPNCQILQQNTFLPLYEFYRGDFGPSSKELTNDVKELIRLGYLKESFYTPECKFEVTAEGASFLQQNPPPSQDVSHSLRCYVKGIFGDMPLTDLIKFVYDTYDVTIYNRNERML